MPWLRDVKYSQGECIALIHDYYNFLIKMYADESAFIWPPPDGWPTITAASLRGLGKSNDVIELLRHIPYRRVNTEIQSAPYSTFLDWTWVGKCGVQQGDEDWKVDAEGIANYQNVPSTVVGLTEDSELKRYLGLAAHLAGAEWSFGFESSLALRKFVWLTM
ncbi:hypothetical protein VFPBJ_09692 [Purpureocillium lilacinum]|uniref:Uncharacterized protein n=1 Tax=Purpureocillium lilacinum TaxID=33203 RepID=A0A179GF14_PURLI|nr:hypothetical protein VFPBJ_09692 [Purpureocillium lilacinum]